MSNPNLPGTLRRAADFLEGNIQREHGKFIRWTPWYIEAIREAADELERLKGEANAVEEH